MKKQLIIVAVAVLLIIGAAWTVQMRLKGVAMPSSLGSDAGVPTPTSATGTASSLPVLADTMPDFTGATAWINSAPLTSASLKGKVVLVDFWTYSCINCIRTLPYTTAWYSKYKDKNFVLIGVHTPEFAFEKVQSNVAGAVKRDGITYPVAMDSDYAIWNSYSNQYWPAEYLFDGKGRLRHVNFGEGKYDETEAAIQSLITENGQQASGGMVTPVPTPDFGQIASQETYLGYDRMELLASPEPVKKDAAQAYTASANPRANMFYYEGTWTVSAQQAVPAPNAAIVYRYQAANANLVMGATAVPAMVEVTLDGAPVPEDFRGKDVTVGKDGKTYVSVSDQRLYELTNAGSNYGAHTLRLTFRGASIAVYAFTFG